MFSKSRIEALSDGIFAITMTLLVLDLKDKLPEVEPALLGHALRHQGHAWFSFIITFALASIFWTLQHRLFDRVKHIGHEALVPSFVFLGLVSLLPFTTHMLGNYISTPLAFVLYFGNQCGIALALTAKLELARRKGNLLPGPETDLLRQRLYTMAVAMGAGAVGACFLRTEWLWIAPVVIGLGARRMRSARRARLEQGLPQVTYTHENGGTPPIQR